MNTTLSILIPEDLAGRVLPKLAKLTRKCGVDHAVIPGLTLVWPGPRYPGKRVSCVRVSVGEFPRANGWSFVARIEHTDAGNLTACAPGETLPEHYRESKPHCEHCHTDRGRKETFVIRGPEGQLMQIGRNCLADFVRADATALIAAAEMHDFYGEADPDNWFGGSWTPETETAHFIACALATTERDGFIKSGQGFGHGTTKGQASFLAGECPLNTYENRELVKDWKEGQPTPEQCERAAVIRQWAIDNTETGDYMYNLRIAAKLPLATKHEGLLASLPNAYERAQGRKTERAARPVSEWLGEVGKRAEWTVTYNGYTAIDGNYGTTWIMRYTGPNGEKLVWFCSGSPKRPIEGSQIKLKATVKRHDFRKGEKQTIVSRGVMTFDDEPAATAAA